MRKRDHSVIQIVRSSIARGELLRHKDASPAFADLVFLHSLVVISSLEASQPSEGEFKRYWGQVVKLSPIEYLSYFDRVSSSFTESLRLGEDPRNFVPDTNAKGYDVGMFSSRVRTVLGALDGASAVRIGRQIFEFPLRFNSDWADADYRSLLEVNATRELSIEPVWLPVLKGLATLLYDDEFASHIEKYFRPHHGPGSVSYTNGSASHIVTGRLNAYQKDVLVDKSAIRYLYQITSADKFAYDCYSTYWVQPSTGSDIPAMVCSVPKSWKKQRLIAVEDPNSMWWEEGVAAGLRAAIKRRPELSAAIDFEHPELNGQLCRLGSIDGSYATIDLSSASDSVGYSVVEQCFGHTPIWKYIKTARKRRLRIPAERGYEDVQSNIFATMGNAICFPVETMVFDLFVRAAKNLCDDVSPHRVYGDDIVVSTRTARYLVNMLTSSGFCVNNAKSFIRKQSCFRESCGYEWYLGEDVNPIRIPRGFKGLPRNRWDGKAIQQLIDLANRCYYTLPLIYRFLVEYVCVGLRLRPPFSRDGRVGIVNADPMGAMRTYPYKIDTASQKKVIRCDVCVSLTKKHKRCPIIALQEWFGLSELRGDMEIENPIITSETCSPKRLAVRRLWFDPDLQYVF